MNHEIIRDQFFLRLPSRAATAGDSAVADDLLDTLRANAERCVGMAANMIGQNVRIIVFFDNGKPVEMFNPEITRKDSPYDAEEGCLSLDGVRPVKRYKNIRVSYQTRDMKPRIKTYTGFTAQIIQHEIDHFEGIII